MRHIRIRKRFPVDQLILVSVLGVLSGLYIWQPALKRYATEQGYIREPERKTEDDLITAANSQKPQVGS